MGEHRSSRLRAAGLAVVLATTGAALTACSLLQVSPSPVATTSAQPTGDTGSTAPTPTATVAPTPDPSRTPLSSPTPTAAPTTVPGSTKKSVTPFITLADWDASAGQLDVSALVPNLVESGGTCTATATSGSVTRTASAPASAVSSYVGCNPMTIPGSALTAGTWTVRVRYSSPKAEGVSAAKTVTVTR